MRRTITVIPRIAEASPSTFPRHPYTTAIGTADPDILIIGTGIVISKVARSLARTCSAPTAVLPDCNSPITAASSALMNIR
jgi:hypothetical protein